MGRRNELKTVGCVLRGGIGLRTGAVSIMHRCALGLALVLLLSGFSRTAAADRPADALLRIAPRDASLTVAVEDLKEHRRVFLGSPLGEAVQTLPSYQRWKASAAFTKFAKARIHIEKALGTDFQTAMDDLLGDSVVLVLRMDPDGRPGDPRGLLLLKFRKEPTVRRLIDAINDDGRQTGILRSLEEKKQNGLTYFVRRFARAGKPDEAYAVLPGQVFVWSNSEVLVSGVLDRLDDGSGLLSDPDFSEVRRGLPTEAVASLYVSGAFLRSLAPDPASEAKPGRRLVLEAVRQYLGPLLYAGLALRVDRDVRLDSLEWRDPAPSVPSERREAASDPESDFEPILSRVPPETVAVAASRTDLASIERTVLGLLDDPIRGKAERLLRTLSGFTLGLDLSDEVLPAIGPHLVGVLAAPPEQRGAPGRPVFLLGFEFQGGKPMALAIENGFRSLMTLMALDPKRKDQALELGSASTDGQSLVTLRGTDTNLAAGVGTSVAAFGNDPETVARFLSGSGTASDAREPMAVQDRRARFPEADAFVHVDLEAAHRLGSRVQGWLVRSVAKDRGGDEASARLDVEQVLGLMSLFRAGYLTRSVGDQGRTVRCSLVLVPRDNSRAEIEAPQE